MKHDTFKEAHGKWCGILMELGVDERYLQDRHGECPMCGGKDRYRFDNKRGDGNWFCNQCRSGNGMHLLMRIKGWDYKAAADAVDSVLGLVKIDAPAKRDDCMPYLRRIGAALLPVDGINPVRLYLKGRGIKAVPAQFLRYHPGAAYYDNKRLVGTFPAMVSALTDAEGRRVTYHMTFLTADGRKAAVAAPKKIMPSNGSKSGCAIRLSEVKGHIAIAEGIETALAVRQLYGVDCWAASNATLLEAFSPPAGVERLSIFADNDPNYAGHKAAYALAYRLSSKLHIDVEVAPGVGTDFADLVMVAEEGVA